MPRRWRRARRVLWGARRGDYQLAVRSQFQLADQGLPKGSECLSIDRATARWWFWIPVA